MDEKTLQIVGTLLLVAGLVLGAIGTYRICTNLPLSDEKVWDEAKRAVLEMDDTGAGHGTASLQKKVELDVWTSALKMTNQDRGRTRNEAIVLLLSGILSLLWGTTVLYNSRRPSKET